MKASAGFTLGHVAIRGRTRFGRRRLSTRVAPLATVFAARRARAPLKNKHLPALRPHSLFSSSSSSTTTTMHPTLPLHVQERYANASSPRIVLTPLEDAVCRLIDQTCRWIARTQAQPDPIESDGMQIHYSDGWSCEARIAGGWVRDKLLDQASHDFDISLSTLTGHSFALLLRQYLLSNDFQRTELATDPTSPFHYSSSASKELIGHVTKIEANPEQSKNLETATANLAGLQLDFVNLRKEVYLGDSRIPTMQFGTAEEDAERRDITINALFYNVHTRLVEDFTGKGLDDMKKGIIRTPLHPNQTFLDDPLRVLRCIRFASRFGYQIDEAIFGCLHGQDGIAIRQALMNKVSRERFGIEFEKMLKGPDPLRAVELIERMGLFAIVLGPPPGSIIRNLDSALSIDTVWRALSVLESLWSLAKEGRQSPSVAGIVSSEKLLLVQEARFFLYFSALLLPLRDQEWEEKKGKLFWAGESVPTNGLKQSRTVRDVLSSMWRTSKIFHQSTNESFEWTSRDYRGRQLPLFVDAPPTATPISARATRAMLIKMTDPRKADSGLSAEETMQMNMLWAMISDLALDEEAWRNVRIADKRLSEEQIAALFATPTAMRFVELFGQLQEEKSFAAVQHRLLLNGKEVMDLLGIPPGTVIMQILGYVEAWQFDQDVGVIGDEETKERCKAWLRAGWDKGEIVPIEQRIAPKTAPPKKKKQQQQQQKAT